MAHLSADLALTSLGWRLALPFQRPLSASISLGCRSALAFQRPLVCSQEALAFFGAAVFAHYLPKGLVLLAVLDFQLVQPVLDFQVLLAALLDPLALRGLAAQESLAVGLRLGWV